MRSALPFENPGHGRKASQKRIKQRNFYIGTMVALNTLHFLMKRKRRVAMLGELTPELERLRRECLEAASEKPPKPKRVRYKNVRIAHISAGGGSGSPGSPVVTSAEEDGDGWAEVRSCVTGALPPPQITSVDSNTPLGGFESAVSAGAYSTAEDHDTSGLSMGDVFDDDYFIDDETWLFS